MNTPEILIFFVVLVAILGLFYVIYRSMKWLLELLKTAFQEGKISIKDSIVGNFMAKGGGIDINKPFDGNTQQYPEEKLTALYTENIKQTKQIQDLSLRIAELEEENRELSKEVKSNAREFKKIYSSINHLEDEQLKEIILNIIS
jgi:predicted RNase H-like nuclease (RuvC/YqgF family)